MVFQVVFPRLGVSIDEGELIEWHKREGDSVTPGEKLFLVETQKASLEVESNVAGKLLKILCPVGTTVKVGQVVAIVVAPGEVVSEDEVGKLATGPTTIPEVPQAPQIPSPSIQGRSQPGPDAGPLVRASPSARRLMREHLISPDSVTGTGPGGLITASDVEKAVQTSSSFKVVKTIELTGRKGTMAKRLSQSGAIPVTLMRDVDATELVGWRVKITVEGRHPSITEMLVPLVAQTLKAHPDVNAVIENGRIKVIENVNIGIAVDTPEGLIVPNLKNADKLSINEVMANAKTLSEKARAGTLTVEELTMGTFTITNLGMFGVRSFTPVVNPPECAILAVGILEERAVAKESKVEVRNMITLSLTFDHRVMDGAGAARFLATLSELVCNPKFDLPAS